MNDRIKELREQAEEWVCKNYPDAMDDNDEFHAQTMAKFAELIVKKCMDIAKYHTPDTEECEYTWLIHDKIQEYFGVE
jgi:hypothetical protein